MWVIYIDSIDKIGCFCIWEFLRIRLLEVSENWFMIIDDLFLKKGIKVFDNKC